MPHYFIQDRRIVTDFYSAGQWLLVPVSGFFKFSGEAEAALASWGLG